MAPAGSAGQAVRGWRVAQAQLAGGGLWGEALRDGQPQSWRAFMTALRDEAVARDGLLGALRAAPWPAFFWETRPVCAATTSQSYAHVLLPAAALERMAPQPDAFAEHFGPGAEIARFENLGGDAMLVVPAPEGGAPPFTHLGAFVRGASPTRAHALLRAVGEAALERLSARPLWLSTSGLGVGWLHVRLDSRPKYYTHAPFRARPTPDP